MGVDDAEGRGLGAQMDEDARKHGVLEHVGKAAGVEGVAIIHARNLVHARKSCRGNRCGVPRLFGPDASA
jgi:hypothetical protein